MKAKNPAEPEFHQAVQEVAESLDLVLEKHPEYYADFKTIEHTVDNHGKRIVTPEDVEGFYDSHQQATQRADQLIKEKKSKKITRDLITCPSCKSKID